MRTEFFLMFLEGNDCQQCGLSHDWRNYIYVNPKNGNFAPVLRVDELKLDTVEMICDLLDIDPPNDVGGRLRELRNKE